MSITDELRHNIEGAEQLYGCECKHLLAIADRIDAEHEEVVRKRQRGCVYYDPERHYCSCHDYDVSGYVELPKDADDVPWNVGDCDEDGNEVIALKLAPDGWYVVTVGKWPYRPEHKRHYHAPTVEDVLTEFGIDWEHESDCEDRAALLKEYASKLRLAKEDA